MNILFIVPQVPWPLDTGSRQRTYLIYKSLSEFAHVDLAVFGISDSNFPEHISYAKKYFNLIDYTFYPAHIDRFPVPMRFLSQKVKQRISPLIKVQNLKYRSYPSCVKSFQKIIRNERYDLIVSRYIRTACKTDALKFIPSIIDVDDVDSMSYMTHSLMPGITKVEKVLLSFISIRINKIINRKIKECDHLWFTSENDSKYIHSRSYSILPNIPKAADNNFLKENVADRSTNRVAVFIGKLTYGANRDGINYFLRKVWGTIIRELPDAKFVIAGDVNLDDKKNWENYKGISVIGYVENIGELYKQARFSIAPIYYGGGTKIKVLESYMFGRPCVVTPHSHYGYEKIIKHGESIFCANTEEDIAKYCITFFKDEDLCIQMGMKGQKIVKNHFTYDKFKNEVVKTVETVTGKEVIES